MAYESLGIVEGNFRIAKDVLYSTLEKATLVVGSSTKQDAHSNSVYIPSILFIHLYEFPYCIFFYFSFVSCLRYLSDRENFQERAVARLTQENQALDQTLNLSDGLVVSRSRFSRRARRTGRCSAVEIS